MKRQIKFRSAYQNYKGKFHGFSYWGVDVPEQGINTLPSMIAGCKRIADDQFTGLTDKHGTDIYEGDIVRFADELFQIGFWRGWFNGMQLGWDGVSAPSKTGWINDSCEVIGSVYETPELLKDKS